MPKKGRVYVLFWRREQDSNPRTFRLTVFKTAALDHSAIPPALPISCEPAGNRPAGYPIWKTASYPPAGILSIPFM